MLLANWKWIKEYELLSEAFLNKNRVRCDWLSKHQVNFESSYDTYRNNLDKGLQKFKMSLDKLDLQYRHLKK